MVKHDELFFSIRALFRLMVDLVLMEYLMSKVMVMLMVVGILTILRVILMRCADRLSRFMVKYTYLSFLCLCALSNNSNNVFDVFNQLKN